MKKLLNLHRQKKQGFMGMLPDKIILNLVGECAA